jgi:site-specific DNA-methyltransferase (adenine-specific)
VKTYELKEILLSEINFGDRVRDPLKDPVLMQFVKTELIPSIKESGLITPICVKAETDNEFSYLLLAGGSRFRAFEILGWVKIPAMIFQQELSALEIAIIEESENLKRRDFSPADKAASYSKIHTLLQEEHGVGLPGRSGADGWTIAKTASFLGKSSGQVSEMLKLDEMFKKQPQARHLFSTTSEASAFLRKAEKGAETAIRVRQIQEKRANTPESILRKRLQSSYILGDFFQEAKSISNGLFDLIEVDPPYSINIKELRKNGENSTIDYNEVEEDQYLVFLELLIKECWRLLKPNGWLLFWFAPDPWQQPLFEMLKKQGFFLRNIPAIWKKGQFDGEIILGGGMQAKTPAYYLARSYESFFYARKGNIKIARPGRPDCFDFPNVPSKQRIHPTERSIGLMRSLLETFVEPGANILVPFAGSGNTLLAAFSLGMKAVGFDLSKDYKNGFDVRVEEMKL